MACPKKPCCSSAAPAPASSAEQVKPPATNGPPPAPSVRHAWLVWVGIPLYIRQHCARRPAGRPVGSHAGCGCLRAAKLRCESWWHVGGLRQFAARQAWRWMPRLSLLLSFALGLYLALRLPVSARMMTLLNACTAGGYRSRHIVHVVKIEGATPRSTTRPSMVITREDVERIRDEAIKAGKPVGQALAEASMARIRAHAAAPARA
jgi:hypothetical protein